MNENKKIELFLDSGAFSAWTQKVEINIQDYIEFIKEHEKLLDLISQEKFIEAANFMRDVNWSIEGQD